MQTPFYIHGTGSSVFSWSIPSDDKPGVLDARSSPTAKPKGVLWPVVMSRPDAAFAVGICHCHSSYKIPPDQLIGSTKEDHKISGERKTGGNTKALFEGYCDADWASQKHWHSISGCSFHFGHGAVSWRMQYSSSLEHTRNKGSHWRMVTEIQGTQRPLTVSAITREL